MSRFGSDGGCASRVSFLCVRSHTRYGEGRASPHSFLTHHVANISTAIQTADAQTILNAASARMLRVSFGVM